jgi:hypothetical protein
MWIELARDDRLRDVPDVCALLPRESGASQVGLGQHRNPLGRDDAGKPLKPSVGGAARRQGNLLLEDDLDQRFEARRPIPERRHTVPGDDRREVVVPPREFGDAFGQVVGGELKSHVHLTIQPTWL